MKKRIISLLSQYEPRPGLEIPILVLLCLVFLGIGFAMHQGPGADAYVLSMPLLAVATLNIIKAAS